MSSTKPTNPKDAVATSRLDLSLFPSTGTIYGALGCTEGDCKYGGYNWRVAGIRWSIYDAAIRRHLDKLRDGEWEDKDTHVPHLASVLASAAIMVDAWEAGKLTDDRPPKLQTAALLSRFEIIVKHLQGMFTNPGRYTEAGKNDSD